MHTTTAALWGAFITSTLLTAAAALAQQAAPAVTQANPPRNVYFGDLHLHTSMSFDAATSQIRTLPEDSYRFALGEPVEYFGQRVRRKTPLDFLAVTDHAEYLGAAAEAADPSGRFAGTQWPERMADLRDVRAAMSRFAASGFRGEKPQLQEFLDESYIRSNWQRQIDAAEKFYQPGKFTTFVAYEWSATPDSFHLHRNVLFRGPKFPQRPFSALDSMKPEDLWRYAEQQRTQGIESLLIPHNSNLSGGLLFAYTDSNGNPISRSYAEARARNEPLVEITQNKGTSETRPELSPSDEFAGFELLTATHADRIDGSFVRQGLGRGLELRSRVGVNPFQYGLIGSSDFHSGISASEEGNFPGALGSGDSHEVPAKTLNDVNPILGAPVTTLSAGGLTGVWAEQNTRESIFDALKRKEAFATSGTRIAVRLFAGWRYPAGITRRGDWVREAYAAGVPMGADLPVSGARAAGPLFIVHALKDPDGANLDRIQIVKVWVQDGRSYERVFDVVGSGNRVLDARTGRLPPVGNTVRAEAATYDNSVGAAQLAGEWRDPQFDPKSAALYYARVLEIPTPRWSTYLAAQNKLPLPKDVPPSIQERAWTSPVFYQP
jgi:hypothetical protein